MDDSKAVNEDKLEDNKSEEVVDLSTVTKLSRINGIINSMNKLDIVAELKKLRLNPGGNREVASKRLKEFYKKQRLGSKTSTEPKNLNQEVLYACVIDFEATCDEFDTNYPHEIIEFPAVLIDINSKEIVEIFHSYCRPSINKELTPFCKRLTGIIQDDVDNAETFNVVLSKFQSWLSLTVGEDQIQNVAMLTDGPWDMGRFMAMQCKVSKISHPRHAKQWINIRKSFSTHYKCKINKGLQSMLEKLELEFEGNPHCGLDDAKNIARIVMCLLNDGIKLQINETLQDYKRRQKARQIANKNPARRT